LGLEYWISRFADGTKTKELKRRKWNDAFNQSGCTTIKTFSPWGGIIGGPIHAPNVGGQQDGQTIWETLHKVKWCLLQLC
jgi:hypothetical protein